MLALNTIMQETLIPRSIHESRQAVQQYQPGRKRSLYGVGRVRASAACTFCQWRKIRCNVAGGAPCSNCRQEDIECVVVSRKRKKKAQNAISPVQSTSAEVQADALAPVHHDINNQSKPQQLTDNHLLMDFIPVLDADSFNQNDSSNASSSNTPPLATSKETPGTESDIGIDSDFVISQNEELVTSSPAAVMPDLNQSIKARVGGRHSMSVGLPEYISPPPISLDVEDAEFLSRKGAFTIPEPDLCNALIRSYIGFVHPLMPVLDLKHFLACIGTGSGQVSLLLLQAVLFAGTSFVEVKELRKLGFLTRKAARRVFFERVKLLYDFEYEKDRLRVIQALFLMTLWYETPDDQKDGWHWLGIALSLGCTIGLDRNPPSNMPIEEQHLRKRIWWTCFMRDPIAAIGVKRPIRILPGDYNVQELVLTDFDLAPPPAGMAGIFDDCKLVYNTDRRCYLARLCIEMTKLCKCLSRILSERYVMNEATQGHFNQDRTVTSMVLLPITEAGNLDTFKQCETELLSWRASLPEEAVFRQMAQRSSTTIDECLIVNRATLNLLYQTTRMTLYRPLTRTHANSVHVLDNAANKCSADTARKAVRSAAAEITKIALDLHQLDILRLLPQTALSVLVSAAMSHISDMECIEETIRNEGLRGFDICWQAIQELRDGYFSADFSSQFVELVIQWTRLRVSQRLGGEVRLPLSPVQSNEQLLARQGESLDMAAATVAEQFTPMQQLATHTQVLPDPSAGSMDVAYPEGNGDDNAAWQQAMNFLNANESQSYIEIESMRDEAVRLLGQCGVSNNDIVDDDLPTGSPGLSSFLQEL